MTTNQLFKAIDMASDKYLSEVLENELESDIRLKVKRHRFSLKLIAVSAACLTLIGAGLALMSKRDEIGALFAKPNRGIIRKSDAAMSYYSLGEVNFGGFSYSGTQNSRTLSVTDNTEVKTDLSIEFDFYHGDNVLYGVVNAPSAYADDNVPARVYLLRDGEPVVFKLGGKSALYHDVTLGSTGQKLVGGTFPVEFDMSAKNEQITALVSIFPDEVFDLNDAGTLAYGSRSALESVRNIAVKPSYYYDHDAPEFTDAAELELFPFFNYSFFWKADGAEKYNLSEFNKPTLKRNIEIDVSPMPNGVVHRLYVMIDGKLTECFDGKYYAVADNEEGSKILMSGECIPESGLHTMQRILEPVIPDSIDESVTGHAEMTETILCGKDIKDFAKQTEDPVVDSIGKRSLRFLVSCDKAEYSAGDKIKVTLTIRNIESDKIMRLHSGESTTGIRLELKSQDGSPLLCLNNDTRKDESEAAVIELQPGEEFTIEYTFAQIDAKTGAQAEPGFYNGTLYYAVYESNGIISTLSNDTFTYRVAVGDLGEF